MLKQVVAIAALLCALPAQAQNMTVSDFLSKADGLQKKSVMALFSSDYKALKSEIVNAGHAWRDDLKAEAAAHKAPSSCPPPPPLALDSDEILKSFRGIPTDQRSHVTVKSAFVRLVTARYPCK